MKKNFLSLIMASVFTSQGFAQNPVVPSNISPDSGQAKRNVNENKSKIETKEKLLAQRKIVLEQILADIEKLEEPDERARYLSSAGKEFCKDGEKRRAVELFERSINEFNTAKAKAEKINDKKSFEIIFGGSTRIQVIQEINVCDSELAYDFLLETRPLKLTETLKSFYLNPYYSALDPRIVGIVSWEISRELNLKREILRVKPERAEEFINRDLNTFISNQTLDSLDRLSGLNQMLSNNLTERVVEKLLRTQFYNPLDKKEIAFTSPNTFQTATSFLKALGNDSKNNWYRIKVSEDTLVKLADKIAKDATDAKYEWIYADALDVIKRLVPDRYAQFEQMKSDKLKTPEGIEARKFKDLMQDSVPVEKLLNDAGSFSEENQRKIYKFAACKLAIQGNLRSADNLLNENFTDKENTNKRLSLILYQFVYKSLMSEKNDFQKAEEWIEHMPDAQLKIDALAFLAETIYGKDKSNKEKSLLLLSKALKEFESNTDSINQSEAKMDIMNGFSAVEPEVAFQMFETILNPNEKLKVNGETYNKYGKIKDLNWIGLFGARPSLVRNTAISNFVKNNFEKTLHIVNNIDSIGTRIFYKLILLESKLDDFYDSDEIRSYCRY